MKKSITVLACVLAAAPFFAGAASADTCSEPLKQCLFVDAAGCSITCIGPCSTTGGYCSFGFGTDAVCKCSKVAPGPGPI